MNWFADVRTQRSLSGIEVPLSFNLDFGERAGAQRAIEEIAKNGVWHGNYFYPASQILEISIRSVND